MVRSIQIPSPLGMDKVREGKRVAPALSQTQSTRRSEQEPVNDQKAGGDRPTWSVGEPAVAERRGGGKGAQGWALGSGAGQGGGSKRGREGGRGRGQGEGGRGAARTVV